MTILIPLNYHSLYNFKVYTVQVYRVYTVQVYSVYNSNNINSSHIKAIAQSVQCTVNQWKCVSKYTMYILYNVHIIQCTYYTMYILYN